VTATLEPEWDLADRLRKALRESGIGAGEMAEYMGVSRTTVSAWLSGKYYPRAGMLRLWAMRTGVSFEWLCAVRDSNPEPAD
jgi:transcriptional regulator with XRE-family HTH domain